MNIERFVITGNVLRISEARPTRTNQFENIEWLCELLSPILKKLGKGAASLNYGEGHSFDASLVYRYENQPVTSSGYLSLLSADPTPDTCAYFSHNISNAFVIGFELPEFMLKVLNRIGVQYMDIVIAPWRFLPDLAIGIRTNNAEIFEKIWRSRLTNDVISMHAGFVRARFARLPSCRLSPNSAFIAGQVEKDQSLVKDGAFLTFEDFEDALQEVFRRHRAVYFKQHPYSPRGATKKQIGVLRRLGDIRITHESAYGLMSNAAIEAVYAITSSVTQEAPFFGIEGHCLSPYPFAFASEPIHDPLAYVPTYDKLLDASAWANWLSIGRGGEGIKLPPGSIRTSIGLDWGLSGPAISKKPLFARIFG